jgi:hypothetical protein
MKKIAIIVSILFCFQIFCNKQQEEAKKEPVKEEEFDEQALTDFREKVKAEMLPGYSNERPFPNVVSKRELMEAILNNFLGPDYDFVYGIFEERPEYKAAEIGGIILVENQSTYNSEEEPYFYYIYGQFKDGTFIGSAISDAMQYLNPGKLGVMSFVDYDMLKTKKLSQKEAVAYIARRYNQDKRANISVKAAVLDGPNRGLLYYHWGWVIKVPEPVSLKVADNSYVKAQIFWVNPNVYMLKEALAQKSITRKDLNSYKTEVKVAVIDRDIFDPEVVQSLKKYSTTPEATENPKITPIEYMVE